MKTRLILGSALAVAAFAAVTGCGGSAALGTASNPRIRVVDALSSPTTVKVTVDNGILSTVTGFESLSDYLPYRSGNRNVTFTDASTGAVIINQTPLFTLNGYYTVIGYASASGPALMVLNDSNHVSSSQATVRFVKAAIGANPVVDFYVTTPGEGIATANALYSGVSEGSVAQDYQSFTAGSYVVTETATGSKVPLRQQTITLGGGTATTLVDAGVPLFLSLQDQ